MFPLPSSPSKNEDGKKTENASQNPGRKAGKSSTGPNSFNGIDGSSSRLSAAAAAAAAARAEANRSGTGAGQVPNADRAGTGSAGGEEEESGSSREQIERLGQAFRTALEEAEGGGVGVMEDMDSGRVGGTGYPSREHVVGGGGGDGGDGQATFDDSSEPSGV